MILNNNEISVLEYNDYLKIASKFNIEPQNVVFWVGSGIDVNAPTCLPVASRLMRVLLSLTCGEEIAANILGIWKTVGSEINNLRILRESAENEFAGLPRLESIIEELSQCESNMRTRHEIMPIIQCFEDAPPNANHYALAKAVMCGANIVTTNYSRCIQSAFKDITLGKYSMNKLEHFEKSLAYIYQSDLGNAGKILHIHGIASSDSKLGASLGSVKNKLPQQVVDILDQWMTEGKMFIFCGYSGSDAFDVNRFFLSKPRSCCKSVGLFIRHSNAGIKQSERKVKEKERILLSSFKEGYVILSDTAAILAQFGNGYKVEGGLKKDYDWEKQCESYFYPPKYRKNLVIKLCTFLGINVTKIIGDNWVPTVEEADVYKPWYTDYPCFAMARLQSDYNLIEQYGQKLKTSDNSVLIDSIIDSAKREYPEYSLEELKQVLCETNKALADLEEIGWNASTLINQYTSRVAAKIVLCRSKEEIEAIRNEFKEGMAYALKTCEIIIEQGYNIVAEMNQLHLALRDAAILVALINLDFEKANMWLDQSTYYYIEVSSIDGIIGNLNSAQIIFALESIYKVSISANNRAKESYRAAKKICDIIGFKRHELIADRNWDFILQLESYHNDL